MACDGKGIFAQERERDTGMPFLGDWSPELLLAVSIWSTGPWIACTSWNVHWWRCKRFTIRNAISWCSWCSLNFVGYFCKASTGVALPDRVNSRWQCIAQLQGLIEQHIEQYSKVAQKVSLNTMLQSCAQSRRRMTRMTQMSRTTWCVYWCILYTLIGNQWVFHVRMWQCILRSRPRLGFSQIPSKWLGDHGNLDVSTQSNWP